MQTTFDAHNQPGMELLVSDLATNSSEALARRTTERTIQALFQRNRVGNTRTEQSLGIYDLRGVTTNAAQGPYADQLHQEVHTLIESRTGHLSVEERGYVGLVLPHLVKALVLDERYIDKVYEPNLTASVAIALDWIEHPDTISQTHIRVGYGGEEVTNSRAPAYIVPALETQKRVRDTFARYGNWALHREMITRIKQDPTLDPAIAIKELNLYLAEALSADYNEMVIDGITADPHNDADQKKLLAEIHHIDATHILSAQKKRQILIEAWNRTFGEKPDLAAIQKKYHFSDQTPTLVVFNAGNAAIEVDGMDRNLVLTARDQTQELLRRYIETFYPELSNSFTFQNDRSWTEHTRYTQMAVMYAHYVASRNTELHTVWTNLAQFGNNHQRHQRNLTVIDSMNPSATYASLHPFFFQDPPADRNPAERLPDPSIMEPVPYARHTIFHQGPPEIQFGVIRKLWAQEGTTKGFIDWLNLRAKTVVPLREISSSVFASVMDSTDVNASNFANRIAAAIKSNTQIPNPIRTQLMLMVRSLVDEPDPITTWRQKIAEFDLFLPKDVEPLKESIQQRRGEISSRNAAIQSALDRMDVESLRGLTADEIGRDAIRRPGETFECTVSVGTIPVYYPLRGADRIVTQNEPNPTLDDYHRYLNDQKATTNRIKGTIDYVSSRILPELQSDTPLSNEWVSLHDGYYGVAPEVVEQVLDEVIPKVKVMYQMVDKEEKSILDQGRKPTRSDFENITSYLKNSILSVATRMATRIGELSGIHNITPEYVLTELIDQCMTLAQGELLRERAAAESKGEAVLHDYQVLLLGISLDETEADAHYDHFLTEVKRDLQRDKMGVVPPTVLEAVEI